VPYSDYAFSALNSSERITLALLTSSTHGNLTVSGLESYISQSLIPYDIRRVLLDIGWQNYPVGDVPQETWVNNWLTASDALGIQDVFYVGQLTTEGVGSTWVRSAIALDPSIQTYATNGTAVPYLSYDSPDVSIFLEKDLESLQSYYGSHPSWVGIGTGSSENDPYYQPGQSIPSLGYSNLTISNFVSSEYYTSDVNKSGFLPNGEPDPLWAAYKNDSPSVVLSSGEGFTTSSPAKVYGNGSLASYLLMRFNLQANVSSLGVSWFGSEVGNPGPLIMELYPDRNGSIYTAGHIGPYQAGATLFSNSTGWQSLPDIRVNLTSGYYWVKFSSPSSDKSNYYQIYMRDQASNGLVSLAWETYVGYGYQHGGTILWLKNQGAQVDVYPYQQVLIENPNPQEFTANRTFSFNTVFLYLSDRIYDSTNGTLTVEDLTDGSKVLATGILSQQLTHGVEGWTPISLNATVATEPGHVYGLLMSEPKGGYSWRVALRGVSTDPPSAGFQGQGFYWLFQLADLGWVQGHLDFHDMTTTGADAITSGYLNAVRFMPSSNQTLKSISILMASNTQQGNYTSGQLTLSIWNSNPSGSIPSSPLPQNISVPATEIPTNGWLNVTGFSQPVYTGRYYWIVFSADTNQSFSMGRFTNAYAFDVLVSANNGVSWSEPHEGPTEFAFVVSLSNQKIGNFVLAKPEVQVGNTGYFAEPFYANKTTQVSGVFLGEPPACIPTVSINPDSGSGSPSLFPIASGVLTGGPQFVQFSSIAELQAGIKYWLVIHPDSGTCNLYPLVYLPDAPNVPPNLPSLISQDDGFTWSKVSNTTSMLVYLLASPGIPLPEFNTSKLAGYLSSFHSPPIEVGIIRGWTGYTASSEFALFGQITGWLSGQTGKNFLFFGNGQRNALNQLPAKAEVILPTSAVSSSCSGLASEITALMPAEEAQYVNVQNSGILRSCSGTTFSSIFQQLDYISGTGESYGQSVHTKVLVVGDGVSANLTRYLSAAYSTTYVQISLDPSLTAEGNLSNYATIVWTSSSNPLLPAGNSLNRYVKAGGTLILAQFGGNGTNLSPFFKDFASSNATRSSPESALIGSILAHTSYPDLTVNSSSLGVLGESPEVSILIHPYGAGEFYFVWFSSSHPSQVSDSTILLSNIIAKSNALPDPIWYGPNLSPQDSLVFTVRGTEGGPILVWLTNTGIQNATFAIHLNGSYYGLASSWKTMNLNNLEVVNGSGSDIVVSGKLPPNSWLPVFIVSFPSAALIEYSSVQVRSQFTYPNQSLYELTADDQQEVLLLIASNTTVSQLLINDNTSLPSTSSVSAFSQASRGWWYYGSSNTVIVKFTPDGPNTLRFLMYTKPTQAPIVLPVRIVGAVLVAMVCLELLVLVVLGHGRSAPRVASNAHQRYNRS